jgi:hypothetical protein
MLLLFSRPAFAIIDSNIKNGTKNDTGEVAGFIKGQIEALGGDSADKRGKAREALVSEVNPVSANQKFNPAFLDTYAQEINKQLAPLVTNEDVRIRLNAAIVVARVAEKVENARLIPIIETLLNDKTDAVLIWGVRASGYVLPPLLEAGVPQQQQKLIGEIKGCAKNPTLIALVYEALTLNYPTLKAAPANLPKSVQLVVPAIMELMQARAEALRTGTDPKEPAADVAPILFLVDGRIWKVCAPDKQLASQQLQIVQVIVNLLTYAGHRVVMPGVADSDQLTILVRKAGRSLGALALVMGDQNLYNWLAPFQNIQPTAANFLATIDQVYPKLQAVTAWKGLKPPGKIETSPGTQPSTAPATAPTGK